MQSSHIIWGQLYVFKMRVNKDILNSLAFFASSPRVPRNSPSRSSNIFISFDTAGLRNYAISIK
ncbi:hypothetical protein Plhal304r1_c055g0141171 [Plasmopara halstedii]